MTTPGMDRYESLALVLALGLIGLVLLGTAADLPDVVIYGAAAAYTVGGGVVFWLSRRKE